MHISANNKSENNMRQITLILKTLCISLLLTFTSCQDDDEVAPNVFQEKSPIVNGLILRNEIGEYVDMVGDAKLNDEYDKYELLLYPVPAFGDLNFSVEAPPDGGTIKARLVRAKPSEKVTKALGKGRRLTTLYGSTFYETEIPNDEVLTRYSIDLNRSIEIDNIAYFVLYVEVGEVILHKNAAIYF